MDNRNQMLRLVAAQCISSAGTHGAWIATLVLLYDTTGSLSWSVALSVVLCALLFGVSPWAGHLGDRFDRRTIMLVTDLLGAASFVALALVDGPLWVVVLTVAAAVLHAPFASAARAAIPRIVGAGAGAEQAVALFHLASTLGSAGGPAVATIVMGAFAPTAMYLVNAGSFVVSTVLVLSLRADFSPGTDGIPDQSSAFAGYRALRVSRPLALLGAATVLVAVCAAAINIILPPLVELLDAGAAGVGFLWLCWALGDAGAALLLPWRRVAMLRTWAGMTAGLGLAALGLAGIAFAPGLASAGVLIGAVGCGMGTFFCTRSVIVQREVADKVASRGFAAIQGLSDAGMIAGAMLGGVLVPTAGARWAFGITALILALALVLMMLRHKAR